MALLIALLAILTFTPLGFILVPPVSITILHLPVIIGAVMLGASGGAIIGAAFGIMSMLKATFAATSPIDMLFSPFLSGTPVKSLIMCVVPRILLGVIAALLFDLFSKVIKKDVPSIALAGGIATICHTVMVLGCLWIMFDTIPLKTVFMTVIGVNGLLELAAGIIVPTAVAKALFVAMGKKKFR